MAIGGNLNDIAIAPGRGKSSSQIVGEFSGVATAVRSTALKFFHLSQRDFISQSCQSKQHICTTATGISEIRSGSLNSHGIWGCIPDIGRVGRFRVRVDSTNKRRLLIDHYGILESQIFSSRTRTSKKGIPDLTDHRGVEIILNSLSGEMLSDTSKCIAEFGVFVEETTTKHRLSMQPFERSITLASIDLDLILRTTKKTSQTVME